MAGGAGDVGGAVAADEAEDGVADDGHEVGAGAGSGLVGVFTEGDVADVVEAVLYGPVRPGPGGEVGRQGADGVAGFVAAGAADRVRERWIRTA